MRVLWVFEHLSCHQRAVAADLGGRAGITLDVMCNTEGQSETSIPNVNSIHLKCRNKLDFSARRDIRNQINKGQYDLAHAYTSRNLANLLGGTRSIRNSPALVGYRGTVGVMSILDPANWITFWHPRLSNVICVSQAASAGLRNSGVASQKLITVYEGCSDDSWNNTDKSKLQEFNIPPGAFVVGAVANMRRVKGLDLLLKAAIELGDQPDIYYLIFGSVIDPEVAKLATHPAIRDRLRLPGYAAKGGQHAGLMDLYVSPSRSEGFGIAIMEAMSQGVCPIVTEVGGQVELVRNQVDGLVICKEDPSALAQAIRQLKNDNDARMRMATSARQRVHNDFSIAKWTDRLVDAYAKIANTRAASAVPQRRSA